jgi:hypothetical protein
MRTSFALDEGEHLAWELIGMRRIKTAAYGIKTVVFTGAGSSSRAGVDLGTTIEAVCRQHSCRNPPMSLDAVNKNIHHALRDGHISTADAQRMTSKE